MHQLLNNELISYGMSLVDDCTHSDIRLELKVTTSDWLASAIYTTCVCILIVASRCSEVIVTVNFVRR